jgi:subtilisin family serine protease
MKPRPSARRGHAPRFDALEAKTLLTVGSTGLWPLPNPGADSSIFVKFQPSATTVEEQAALNGLRASVATTYPDGSELIDLGAGIAPGDAVKRLSSDAFVNYAAVDATIHIAAAQVVPNDPQVSQQWALDQANGVNIDATSAWGITTGSVSTIVAVIDTGIDLNNPDFAGKVWTNPNTAADAASGYVNDIHGWNFVSNNNNVQDDNGHGSHVSGILGALGNNSYGVAGVDWNVQIMPLKFLDANGNGTTDNAVTAIYFAVGHGAKVINASWGGQGISQPLEAAIQYADQHGVTFVTAAGNDGTDNDLSPSYPASYALPNELSVAAIDESGNLASYSNYGAGTVNLAAPGSDIVSDVPTSIDPSGLATYSGTSMSTAYVSGVAALLYGLDPNLTAEQVVQRIDSTTKQLPSLAGKTISGGIVDAYNAITGTTTGPAAGPVAAGTPVLVPGASTAAQVRSSILASDEFFVGHGASPQGFITGLYEDLLGRVPDAAGLDFWVNVYDSGTTSRYQIAYDILTSPEGRLTEVAHWFQNDLGRTESLDQLKADPGVSGWAGLLLAGIGDNTVEGYILSSAEYLTKNGSSPDPVIAGLYQTVNDRTPSATEDTAWAGLLLDGFQPYVVIRYFQGTPEAADTEVARWFETDLGRAESIAQLKADPGVQAWGAELGDF